MAGQADGSIIVDTELSPEGFKAGSSELLAAIKSLSTEIKALGESIKSTFGSSGVGKSTQETDGYIQELQNRIKELEDNLAELKKQQISPQVDNQTQEQIRALSETVARLQSQLAETSKQPISPEVDIGEAEAKIAALEAKVLELEQVIASLQSGDQSAGANINFGGTTGSASALQREIESVCNSVNNLEPTFQRAMNGSESAMTSFQSRASQLESKIASLKAKLAEMGNTRLPTADFAALTKEEERAGLKLEALLNKQERMQAMGVKTDSAQWKNLAYDLQLAAQKYDQLVAAKARMEAAGTAYVMGSETQQYAAMSSALSAAQAKMEQMRASSAQTAGIMSRLASGARSLMSHLGSAAATIGKGILSGLRSAVTATKKLIASNKSYRNSFGGVLARIKQIGPALLMARGVMGMLRKAVNAYMQANQELANTLSSCWTGIGNLLGPIIERLINLLATAVAYFTAFLKLLGFVGKSASKAIGGAGGKAKEETDKLKRSLASFDDLNILSDNSSDEGGGGGGAGASELPPAELPDWAKLMANQLKNGDWKGAAKTLTNQLNSMVANVNWSDLGTKIGGYLDGVLSFLATAITSFDWFSLGSNFAESINSILYSVDWANLGIVLGAKIIVLLELMAGFFKNFDWVALGKALADAFMGLWNSIDWVQTGTMLSDGIKGVLNSISTAIKNVDWKKLGSDVADFIAAIDWSGVTSALFDGIGAALGGLTAFLWGLIEDAWNSIVEWWNDVAYEGGEFTMKGLLNGLWAGICNIGQWLMDHIVTPFIDGFCDAFGIHSPSTVMAGFGENIIEGLLNGLTSTWDSIVSFFGDALSSIGSSIKDWATNAANTVSTWASNTKSTVTTWASNVKNSVTTWATNTESSISNWVSSTKSSISTWGSNVYSTISSKVSSFKSTIASGFEAAKSSITSKMTSALDTIKNQGWSGVGDAICTGIGNGISNGWSWLKNKVSNVATGLLDAAKSALGIHSPSRLFRDVIGLNIGYGVGEGIEASESSVLGSVTSVADAIAAEFAAGEYKAANIAPVSEVDGALTSFADQISGSFENLISKLQAIAETVTFRMPAIANSAVPYGVSAKVSGSDDGLCDALTASNDAVAVVIARAIAEATRTVVTAIQENAGGSSGLDDNARTTNIINEINRRTMSMGASPLL